ncbi:cilia- and flagella-associated protein 69 [Clupea harengus]|uniref:Cilia- and flagella-associated protein 69 n=1 Tax=Clupea harengus TaxID=7950 RepID=A0A6P8H3V7_CLUHA|nr:cilia- and flagella-associated protein 69 [Clupea harengus]
MLASETRITKSSHAMARVSKTHSRKPGIPVVNHTISAKGKGEITSVKPSDLNRVLRLLTDPLTVSLKDRHLFTLKKLVKTYQKGFLLRDLESIFKIVGICAEKSKDHPEYTSILYELLKICGLPFLKEKTSDEVKYTDIAKQSLSQLGYLMRVPNADVRLQICASISSFCNSAKTKPPGTGLQPLSLSSRLQLLEQSGVAETLVLSLVLLEDQLANRLQLLHTLQVLSCTSEVNCELMLKAQAAQKICLHMNEPDPSGQVLFRSSEILWNLLERGCSQELTDQLSNMDSILCLKEAFLSQLQHGYRNYDHQLRNDLLVITTLIAENPKAPLIESGFARQLILFATYPEMKSHNPLTRNLKLTFNNEDFEMKKLLLNIVVVMSQDLSSVQLFREGKVMLALMYLVKPPDTIQSSGRSWTPVQQEELQLQALATLATVAPLMLEEYMTCQANTCLLMLLEWCVQQDAYFGQGHSFHGTGGRGSKKAQLRYSVRLLRSMVSLANLTVNQDLCDQGAISLLLGLLMQLGGPDDEDAVTLEIKVDLQLILSTLCESDLHRKELFGTEGVDMTIRFLKMNPAKFYSGMGHSRLILSTVDCVWSCIIGCFTNEDVFLEKEGVFLLFDLIHSSPMTLHGVVLGALLELCDNPKALTHVHGWRGPGGASAPHLLLQLWRQEEEMLGVQRDQHGQIADPVRPLVHAHQEEQAQVSTPAHTPSAAVVDVAENQRCKIYGFFCKLGFEDLPGLTTEDFITLSIVSRYLDFKTGEIWEEISRELALDGVRPVTPDAEALETISQATEDTAKRVAEQQTAILQRQGEEDTQKEKEMYAEMRSNHKQQELTAKSWEHFVAKTSDYKILKECKKHQEKSIESSRLKAKGRDSGTLYHHTHIPGLQTTAFCGRVMAVESTPAHLTGGPLASTDLALARVPIQGGALRKLPQATAQDLEHLNAVTVQ